MGMDKDAGYQVIEMIKRRIEESHQTEAALEHDAPLRREQEYGKRRALLDLWEDLLDAMEVPDTHQG